MLVGKNSCNKKYFERKDLSGIRFTVSPTKPLVLQTVDFLQDIKHQFPHYQYKLLSLQASSRITSSSNSVPSFESENLDISNRSSKSEQFLQNVLELQTLSN